eukprot:2084687-Prymnesium_polylepis.1
MIKLATYAHGDTPSATFADRSFDDECASGSEYETIVFNGVLQFFEDPASTLSCAAQLLSDSPDARLVVSHVSGASFVRRELGDNPTTVKNVMPTMQKMQGIAEQSNLQLIIPSFLGTEVDEIERNFESFYLVILQRKVADTRQ